MKAHLRLLGKFLNHCSTEKAFFLWFTLLALSSFLLMLSRICLLIFPFSCFDGLINLHVGLFSKLYICMYVCMHACMHVLLLLYVNDIHRCLNKFRFYLFADGTNILCAEKNLKDLETIVNIELQNPTN